MNRPVAILSNRLYVPIENVDEGMKTAFTKRLWPNKDGCDNCGSDDPEACRGCPHEPTTIKFYKEHDDQWVSFPRGDLGKLYEIFSAFKIEDQRAYVPLTIDLQWRDGLDLWDNQLKAVNEWLEYRYGILKAPPRSGKTVMFVWLACVLKQKVLILARQSEWLDQFIVAFRSFTNIDALEKADGKKYIGWIKKWEDIDKQQISVLTYQKYIHNKSMVAKHRDKFGVVFVDECDQSAAKCFHQVINGFNAAYRFGCTATPIRKDELHIIANAILGPVTAKGVSKQLPCKVFYQHTGFKVKDFKMWGTFINRITKDKARTDFIVEKIVSDVARGRYVVVVTDRVAHAQTITRLLNIQDIEAVCFHGGMKNRAELMQKVKDGEVPVVVAIRKLIQRGIDVMYWDSIHITTPTANAYNYEQEVARVRTPYSDALRESLKHDKPKPEINLYLDIGKIAFAVKGVAERVHATLRGQ